MKYYKKYKKSKIKTQKTANPNPESHGMGSLQAMCKPITENSGHEPVNVVN